MSKEHIIAEIHRTARENGDVPLGQNRFKNETGIGEASWTKYWARWGDALLEAGYQPNKWQEGYDEEFLIEALIDLIQELGKFPTLREMKLKSSGTPDFPSHSTFKNRLGKKHEIAKRIVEFCQDRNVFPHVQKICLPVSMQPKALSKTKDSVSEGKVGYVYLIQHGNRREYKIGMTYNPIRREGEIRLQLPEKVIPIHTITTDDPSGVERYWHKRFAKKRKEGEWFQLSPSDIKAFKKWKKIY